MKQALFSVAMLGAFAHAQQVLYTDAETKTTISSFGNIVQETKFDDMIHKIITKATIPFAQDYAS